MLQEIWEDGRAFLQLNERSRAVVSAKDAAETQRKAVKRKLPLPPSGAGAAGAAGAGGDNAADLAAQAEFVLSEEVHKVGCCNSNPVLKQVLKAPGSGT